MAEDAGEFCVSVVFVRGGRNLGSSNFFPRGGVSGAAEVLASFLSQYYLAREAPGEIVVERPIEDAAPLAELLAQRSGHAVAIRSNVRGTRSRWLSMARTNAALGLKIRAANRANVAQQRAARSAQRAFYLPELSLRAVGSEALERSGRGSESGPGFPDDQAWNVTLQASLPLFTGGARRAEYARNRYGLRQLEAQRESTADAVEARTRAALHRTASSYPAIELSQDAAAAARENLAMVRDAYAKGALSVTDLVDAQDASLEAELAAAEAKYTFLIDFVAVLRATGDFDMLLDPASRQSWFERVDAWFREHASGAPAR